MEPLIIYPDRKLLPKMFVQFGLLALMIVGSILVLTILIALDEGGRSAANTAALIVIGINLLWIVPGLLLITPYYRSLQYEIQDDEVIVRVGIITKSIKHVPYRTVTNIAVKRGPFDRLFGLGTLNIQTAGMSGSSGVEEALIGLLEYNETYDLVAKTLRRYRSAMAPTGTNGTEALATDEQVLAAILDEVKRIRQQLG